MPSYAPAPPGYVPPAAPEAYAPPGAPAAAYAPPAAPEAYAPPGAPGAAYAPPEPGAYGPPRRRSRTLLVIGVIALVVIAALGGGAVFANAQLSSMYSPSRSVTDYLAAQARGDVPGMMSNATFVKGDSGYPDFFRQAAVAAMMQVKENRAISGVSVTSTQDVDSSTSKVTVAMTWNGDQRTQTYTVRKDTSRVHDLLYYSWRADIPSNMITWTLPNQPGPVQVDGISVPSAAGTSLQVIQGYHGVVMLGTDFYDADTESVNVVEGAGSVAFKTALSSSAVSAGAAAIKDSFKPGNVTCSAKSIDCPGKTYHPQAGYYETLLMPGGNINAYTSWVFNLTGDPTSGMKLVVTATTGKITASGACTTTLTVDGSKTFHYAGTWTGTLTWSTGGFAYNGTFSCDDTRV